MKEQYSSSGSQSFSPCWTSYASEALYLPKVEARLCRATDVRLCAAVCQGGAAWHRGVALWKSAAVPGLKEEERDANDESVVVLVWVRECFATQCGLAGL